MIKYKMMKVGLNFDNVVKSIQKKTGKSSRQITDELVRPIIKKK